MKPLAFSPGSITAFFRILPGKPPLTIRSRGMGINIREGVSASLEEGRHSQIFFNEEPTRIAAVEEVIQKLAPKPIHVFLKTPLPIGCGCGVSAAATLSTTFALNRYFDLQKTREDLMQIAYVAELNAKTGVGDVLSQVTGGIVYRGEKEVSQLSVAIPDFYCSVFGPIETKLVLQSPDVMEKVNRAGEIAVRKMDATLSNLSWKKIMEIAAGFSKECGLLTQEASKAIQRIEQSGGEAFMIMLGNAVLATLPLEGTKKSWKTNIDREGTRVL